MFDFLKSLLTAQTGSLLIVFGMVLLLLAIIGAVQGKISLDSKARIAGGTLGLISLTFGVWLQIHNHPSPPSTPVQANATLPSAGGSISGQTPSKADSNPIPPSTTKTVRPPDRAKQKPVAPEPTVSPQGGVSQAPFKPTDSPQGGVSQAPFKPIVSPQGGVSQAPPTPPKAQTCRINPTSWRWQTTGKLLIEVDGRRVGVINVGKDQRGFDFACSPGDHRYRVHSDTMQVACSGAIVLDTDATALELAFSQPAPGGPPDCSLATVP